MMKMKRNTDWTDVLRSTLRDAEISPSEGSWERLQRELEGHEPHVPEPGMPLPRKNGWRIHGPRIAAAAAVVLIAVVAGELLWRSGSRELGDFEDPLLASMTVAGDSAVDRSRLSASGSAAGKQLPASGENGISRQPAFGSDAVAENRPHESESLRETVARATGWSQGPDQTTGQKSAVALLALRSESAADRNSPMQESENGVGKPLEGDPASVSGGVDPQGGDSETTESLAGMTDDSSVGSFRMDGDTGADSRGRVSAQTRAEAQTRTNAQTRTDAQSPTGAQGGVEARNGADARNGEAVQSRINSAASDSKPRAARGAGRNKTAARRDAGSFVAFTESFAGERPRESRTSLSLFAGGGTSGGNGLQGSPLRSYSSIMANDAVSVVGNGNNLQPMQRRDYDKSSFRHHLPLSFGLTVRKELPHRFSLESGVVYTLLRSDVRLPYSSDDVSQKLHFVGIPLRMNWQFVERGPLTAYLGAGGMAEKCIAAKFGSQTVDEAALQWSLLAAVGAQYRLADYVGLYFEPEVSWYLTDTELRTSRSDAPLSLTLRLGVRVLF